VKTTTAFGVVGSVAVNLMLGLIIAAVFSVTPPVQAKEVLAQCPEQAAASASHTTPVHQHQGGHLVAVRMGWEAG